LLTHFFRIFLQAFVLNHIQHRHADGARNRITAKGVEILHAIVKGIGNFRSGHDSSHGMTVANGFAHGDDVGNTALGLKRPEVGSWSAESHLDLVRNADATASADMFKSRLHVVLGQHQLSSAPQNALTDESRHAPALLGQFIGSIFDIGGIGNGCIVSAAFMGTAVAVGHDHRFNTGGRPFSTRAVMLVGAHIDQQIGVAVVGSVQ